jgi:hypothetical protein
VGRPNGPRWWASPIGQGHFSLFSFYLSPEILPNKNKWKRPLKIQ